MTSESTHHLIQRLAEALRNAGVEVVDVKDRALLVKGETGEFFMIGIQETK
jgi:hypothetical protein